MRHCLALLLVVVFSLGCDGENRSEPTPKMTTVIAIDKQHANAIVDSVLENDASFLVLLDIKEMARDANGDANGEDAVCIAVCE